MPITFHFRAEDNLVICVHKGDRPDDEFLAACKNMYRNELYDLSMNRLIDMREAVSDTRSTVALRQLAEFVNMQFIESNEHPKIAVIAPNDLSFGISRMYEIFADAVPWELVVFRSVDAALAWLGLPEDLMDSYDVDTQ